MSHGAMSQGAVLQKGLVTLALVASSMFGGVSAHAGEPGRNQYQPVAAKKSTTVVAAKPVAAEKTAFWQGYCRPVQVCPTPNSCYPVTQCSPSYYRPQYPVYGNPGYMSPGYGSPMLGGSPYGVPSYGVPSYGVPSYGVPSYTTPVIGAPVYGAPAITTPVYGPPAYGTSPYVMPAGPGIADPFTMPVSNPGYFGAGIQPAFGSPYFP